MDSVSLYGNMIGERWREKVLARIDSQEALEDATEATGQRIPQATLSRLLSGESKTGPKWHHMVTIARALKLSLDFLADDNQDAPAAPELSEDERSIVQLVRDMGMDRPAAVKRLTASTVVTSPNLSHGEIEDAKAAARKRRGRRPGA